MSYSFEVNSVNIEGRSTPLPSFFKKNLSSAISSELSKMPLPKEIVKTSISLDVDGIRCNLGNQTRLITTRHAKKISLVIRGYFQSVQIMPQGDPTKLDDSRKYYKELHEKIQQGTIERLMTVAEVGSNSYGFYKKLNEVFYGPGPKVNLSTLTKVFNCASSVFQSFSGITEMYYGHYDLKFSEEINDREGMFRAKAKTWSGRAIWTGAMVATTLQVVDLISRSAFQVIAECFKAISTSFMGISSLIGIFIASIGIYRCVQLQNRVQERYLDNQNIAEDMRYPAAFKWLQSLVNVTRDEIESITKEVGQINNKEEVISQKIDALRKTKIRYFKRRTNLKSVDLLLNKSEISPEQSKVIVKLILKESKNRMAIYMVAILAALIGLAALALHSMGGFDVVSSWLLLSSSSMFIVLAIVGIFSSRVRREEDAALNGFNLNFFR